MKVAFAVVGALMLAAAPALAQAPEAHTPEAGSPADRSQRILTALVQMNGVPGMAAAVWKDGELIWSGAAGYADLETRRPVDGQTVFRMASVSKLFAAVAIGRLVEKGRLDLDAPVQTRLPWLTNDWPAISLRQLASHTSGMPHYQVQDLGRGDVHYPTVRDAVGIFSDRTLLAPPGQTYSYSSWGYTLISAGVEAGAGQPYLDYVAAEITPGLNIGADATDGPNPHASVAYDFVEGAIQRAPRHDFSYTWAGGGMGATVPDLATWGGRVLDGQVIGRETFEDLLAPTRLNDGSVARNGDATVGVGWRVSTDRDGRRLVHHAGAALGARSALVLYPDQRAATAIASNASWTSAIETTAQMLAAPFLPARPDPTPIPCPTQATAYRGAYGDALIEGRARFRIEDGVCVGELELAPGNAYGGAVNGQPQADTDRLDVIGVEQGSGLGRAALITPIGVLDLRDDGEGGWRLASAGGGRSLSFRLD